jgi:hypothetical protein
MLTPDFEPIDVKPFFSKSIDIMMMNRLSIENKEVPAGGLTLSADPSANLNCGAHPFQPLL